MLCWFLFITWTSLIHIFFFFSFFFIPSAPPLQQVGCVCTRRWKRTQTEWLSPADQSGSPYYTLPCLEISIQKKRMRQWEDTCGYGTNPPWWPLCMPRPCFWKYRNACWWQVGKSPFCFLFSCIWASPIKLSLSVFSHSQFKTNFDHFPSFPLPFLHSSPLPSSKKTGII